MNSAFLEKMVLRDYHILRLPRFVPAFTRASADRRVCFGGFGACFAQYELKMQHHTGEGDVGLGGSLYWTSPRRFQYAKAIVPGDQNFKKFPARDGFGFDNGTPDAGSLLESWIWVEGPTKRVIRLQRGSTAFRSGAGRKRRGLFGELSSWNMRMRSGLSKGMER